MQVIRTMAAALLLMAALPATSQTIALDSLPQASLKEIDRVCLPVQYRDGAGAYRNCVKAELDLRANGDKTDLGTLSFDDKYAVQQACAKAGEQTSTNYQSCISAQITDLASVAKPELDKLSEDELYVVQQSCFDAQSNQGAAKYRQCLNGEVQSLLVTPAVDTSDLDMLKKNALQLRCSSTSSNAVQYRDCIATQFESIAGFAPSFVPVSNAPEVTASAAISTPVAAQPAVSQTEPVSAATAATPIKPRMVLPRNIQPPREVLEPRVTGESLEIVESVESVEVIESIPQIEAAQEAEEPVLTVAEAPITVLAQNSVDDATTGDATPGKVDARVISRPELIETLEMQKRANAQGIELAPDADTAANRQPMEKVGLLWQKFLDALAALDGFGWLLIAGVLALPAILLGLFSLSRRLRKTDETSANNTTLIDRIEPGMRTRQVQHEQEAAELFADEEVSTDHDNVTHIATKSERPDLRQPEQQPASEARLNSEFGQWLMQLSDPARMQACIELLIYWVAYGDDRYQPDLQEQLFAKTDQDAHDQIKLWVLEQDVFAFADAVGWLRTHASQRQLKQSIGLIMALLVTENSVSPTQNTLLRFLSDAFGIGGDRLEQRFEQAFGHALPPVPRTDSDAWWEKQESEIMQRWDARSMATRSETEQMTARLGLTSDYDEAQVINAFRRAARRCHPDRFTELGDRERALAEQQFNKFEQARDKLLGVSV